MSKREIIRQFSISAEIYELDLMNIPGSESTQSGR